MTGTAYLYIVHAPEVGRVKIGRTFNLTGRLQTLQTNSPCALELVVSFELPRNEVVEAEAELHERFIKHHSHGEWFSDEILQEVRDLVLLPEPLLVTA